MGTKRFTGSPRLLIITVALAILLGTWGATALLAQGSGNIDGKIERPNGQGIGGVTVVVTEVGRVEITNNEGAYRFAGLPEGDYNVSFTLGDNATSEQVAVVAGQTERLDVTVDWDVSFAETITIYSASRRRERITDAPASVTLVTEQEIERESSTGQLAKVLEFAPGVEVTQSGIHDFNLNTRGFNSSLNRRVQVLVDGRNPQVPFLGSTEWLYLSNMEDMASVELVRGPSSALYGANAFNGVLNMVTKAPRDTLGGELTLAGGELSTLRGDLVYGFDLGNEWYLKANAAYTEGEHFYQPRVTSVEYPGLPREATVGTDEYDSTHVNLRLDKYLRGGSDLLTIEGGYFDSFGGVVVTGIGRVNILDGERSHVRLNYNSPHWNVLAYQNTRETPDQIALASGGRIFLDTEQRHAEIQGNGSFADGKVRLVGGISATETEIDTANFQGQQTLIFAPVDSDSEAAFAQLDFDIGDSLKLVLAGRFDQSSLHDDQVSPKAALVWSVTEDHTLRFSYNEAFQVANYSEFFLDAPTAIPTPAGPISSIDLSGIEALLCAPFGVTCGFGSPVGVRALGNEDLEVEEVEAIEVGYSGIFGSKAYLTVDYYQNDLENFITDLLPNAFGSINPTFGPYTPPANHPAPGLLVGTLQGVLPPSLFAFLSNNVDGTPIFALASYTNTGQVDTEGVDLGLNFYATPQWVIDFSYSWFDFEIVDLGILTSPIVPNAPENKASAGVTYTGPEWGFSLNWRWVDDFRWEAGTFEGDVESYNVVDLSANYRINDRVALGLNVSNLFDNEHYQSFGGDLLERRALATLKIGF